MSQKSNAEEFLASIMPDASGRVERQQAALSSGRRVTFVLPHDMSKQEVADMIQVALAFAEQIGKENGLVDESTINCDDIELPFKCSGRSAVILLPNDATPEELMEMREDMMSLCQPHVLEDAIMESKAMDCPAPDRMAN